MDVGGVPTVIRRHVGDLSQQLLAGGSGALDSGPVTSHGGRAKAVGIDGQSLASSGFVVAEKGNLPFVFRLEMLN